MEGPDSPPGMPRWVKVFALGGILVILLVIVVIAFAPGGHGPGRHAADDKDTTTSASPTTTATPPSAEAGRELTQAIVGLRSPHMNGGS